MIYLTCSTDLLKNKCDKRFDAVNYENYEKTKKC